MAQPYAETPRPETGMTNGRLGTWMFLSADFMFCGALVSSYALLRTAAPMWPPSAAKIPVTLPMVVFILLVCTAAFATRAARQMQFPSASAARKSLLISVVCALIASVIVPVQMAGLIRQDLVPATDNFYGLYYVIGGIAYLHIALATLWSLHLAGLGFGLAARNSLQYANRLACTKLVWMFTALLWAAVVFMFCLA